MDKLVVGPSSKGKVDIKAILAGERDPAVLAKSLETISQYMGRQVKRELITEDDQRRALKLIETATDYAIFADCDVVIEAATEKEEIKRQILKQLCPALKPSARFCRRMVCGPAAISTRA